MTQKIKEGELQLNKRQTPAPIRLMYPVANGAGSFEHRAESR